MNSVLRRKKCVRVKCSKKGGLGRLRPAIKACALFTYGCGCVFLPCRNLKTAHILHAVNPFRTSLKANAKLMKWSTFKSAIAYSIPTTGVVCGLFFEFPQIGGKGADISFFTVFKNGAVPPFLAPSLKLVNFQFHAGSLPPPHVHMHCSL